MDDDQKVKFGDNDAIYHDGNSLILSAGNAITFSNEISGIGPSGDNHLATKKYIDDRVYSGCRVYRSSSNQTISNGSFTKVQFNSEEYDNLNEFDSSANYRFTPKRSGIYLVTSTITWVNIDNENRIIASIYKDDIETFRGTDFCTGASGWAGSYVSVPVKLLVGSYIEIYAYQANPGVNANSLFYGSGYTYLTINRIA